MSDRLRVSDRCPGLCNGCVPVDTQHQCWHDIGHEGDCTCRPNGRDSGPVIVNPLHDPACTCPQGIRSLGRLYGVSMGEGCVRLDTDFRCPVHGGQDLSRAARNNRKRRGEEDR